MELDRYDLMLIVAGLFYAYRISRPWLRRRSERKAQQEQAALEAIWRQDDPPSDSTV